MKLLLTVLMFIYAAGSSAQIIDNEKGSAFSDDPFFNEAFIRNNKVKTIIGSISTKKKLQPIQTRGLVTHYEFDKHGKLKCQFSTRPGSAGDYDTTVMNYIYDDKNRLITKRMNDNYGFYSYNYSFDSSGLLVEEKYCRDKNVGPSKHDFELGKQYVIVNEKFKNEWVDDTTLKRKYFNNYGRPYQEKYFKWNSRGYFIEEETVLLLNRKRNTTVYEYDEKGRVIKKTQKSNVTQSSELVQTFEYDQVGNLTMSDEYRNGRHITKREVLYDKETMLMKAIILVDIATEYMTVIKYEYEYYE